MMLIAWLLLALVGPVAPPAVPAEAPLGVFQQWNGWERRPLDFSSAGLHVTVEPLPCTVKPHADDSSCAWDGYNNQASITVAGPGLAPFRTTTDSQASYVRVAVVRLDRRDSRPGLVVDNQYGGSGGGLTVFVVVPDGNGYRRVDLKAGYADAFLEGEIEDGPVDLSGDGRVDFVVTDGRFDSAFGCNACTPRPPVVLTVRDGRSADISTDPAVGGVFRHDMERLREGCLSDDPGRDGVCAAYAADAARLGQFDRVWPLVARHYEGSGSSFPNHVQAFLRRAGYLR